MLLRQSLFHFFDVYAIKSKMFRIFVVSNQKNNPMEAIFSFFSEHYPTIGLFVAVIVVVSVVVYKATIYHVSIRDIRKKVDELPCDAHEKKINGIFGNFGYYAEKTESAISHLKDSSEEMRKVLVNISGALINKKMIAPVSVLQKFSPYRLTEDGEKHLVASGGKACIDLNLEFFISELEKRNPQNAYDVENEAGDVILVNSKKPFFKGIKNYIFLDPEGISFISTILAMGIYLRDKYFEVHPELLPDRSFEAIDT